MAEIQEDGKWPQGIKSNEGFGEPRKIYNKVINELMESDKNNPLIQLALLKLAVLYQGEQDYESSLQAIKKLINNFPKTSLRVEARYTLEKTLRSILKAKMHNNQYQEVIEIYQKEKRLFSMLESPELLLMVARAFIALNNIPMALPVYKRAIFLLPEENRPPDLLYFMGEDAIRRGQEDEAISWFKDLNRNYPQSDYSIRSYRVLGEIFFNNGKYKKAIDMFSKAILYTSDQCLKLDMMIKSAISYYRLSKKRVAYRMLKKTDKLKCESYNYSADFFMEKGNIFLETGHIIEAISSFSRALELQRDESIKSLIRFKMSRCYEIMKQDQKAIELLKKIATTNDTFWAMVAKEKLKEKGINIESGMNKRP
jgi:tetratricopeptide (TPR) repeat protein